MKKNAFIVLSVIIMCSMFSSCGVVEQTYPLIDYVTVEKSSQDLYARNDAFAVGDTMCMDTTLVASFAKRKNISSKYQYIISKPKVEWQRKKSRLDNVKRRETYALDTFLYNARHKRIGTVDASLIRQVCGENGRKAD